MSSAILAAVLVAVGLFVDSFEEPVLRRFVGEAEEGFVRELDVPFDLLPTFVGVPPMTGERKGAVGFCDGAVVWAGEEGERVRETAVGFGCDVDGEWGAVSL